MPIQLRVDDPRLDAYRPFVGGYDTPHAVGEIDDEAPTERFSGQTCAGTSGMDRNLILAGVLKAGRHVRRRTGTNNTQRPDLIDARIARIELQKNLVAVDFPGYETPQVFLDPLMFLVHRTTYDLGLEARAAN